ncbi:uncharacterized protein ACO6RY_07582 [Pungitius sinensis]
MKSGSALGSCRRLSTGRETDEVDSRVTASSPGRTPADDCPPVPLRCSTITEAFFSQPAALPAGSQGVPLCGTSTAWRHADRHVGFFTRLLTRHRSTTEATDGVPAVTALTTRRPSCQPHLSGQQGDKLSGPVHQPDGCSQRR